jgi:hypothetical protein
MNLGNHLWIAFGLTLIALTVFILLFAATYTVYGKFEAHGMYPYVAIASLIVGPIVGVVAVKNSIQTVGAHPAVIAIVWIVSALGAYEVTHLMFVSLGVVLIPVLPFVGAFLATFITRGRP